MSEPQVPAEWDRPRSPCTKVCSLDEQGYCVGCLRTADEIGRWTSMNAAEQWITDRRRGWEIRLDRLGDILNENEAATTEENP